MTREEETLDDLLSKIDERLVDMQEEGIDISGALCALRDLEREVNQLQ